MSKTETGRLCVGVDLHKTQFTVCALSEDGEYLLEKKYPTDRPISFTSDYKKVSVRKEDILYVESRDSEVWIVTRDGLQHRNKTGIGQWEDILGPDFLRIHRSFLVNVNDARLTASETVSVAGTELPVSRKYKDAVVRILKTS